MDKIRKRNVLKEQPDDFQICLIFPHFVKAEYQDGFFLGQGDKVMYIGVKYWVPIQDVTSLFYIEDD